MELFVFVFLVLFITFGAICIIAGMDYDLRMNGKR